MFTVKKSVNSAFSILVAIALLASLFTGIPIRFSRQKEYTENEVLSFVSDLKSLTSSYNDYEQKFDEDKNNIGLSTNRIIVKTDEELTDTNSVSSIFGIGYQILQYEDDDSFQSDKEMLASKGYELCSDSIITAAEDSADGEVSTDADMWSYEHLDIENNKNHYNSDDYDEIVIGVIDSGIDYSHKLFADRIIENNINFSSSGKPNDSSDDEGHGTAVSGIIAESTPANVKIKPYKFLNNLGKGTVAQFIAVAEYILSEKDKPDILNLSFGAYNFEEEDLQAELCERLVAAGITVVIASGNDNLPTKYLSPAGADSAITVGAYDCQMHISSFSNYGDEIDVAAPGENVYTAALNNSYSSSSGTSLAAPFVSSACAYVLMNQPDSKPSEIKQTILSNSIAMDDDEAAYFGSGMLSITNIVNERTLCAEPDLEEKLYDTPQTLSFENIPENGKIIYTTDLSVPTLRNGIVYDKPINIDNDVQINYAVFDNEGYLSDIKSCHYSVLHYASEKDFKINIFGVITSFDSDQKNIIVPEKINGITPVEIGKKAFSNSQVTSVVLPDTVKKINHGFENLRTLKHITAIGAATLVNAFSGCSNLRDEIMPNVSSVSGSFKNCTMLHSIDFGEKLTKLNSSDFEGTGIVYLDIPNAVHYTGAKNVFTSSTLINVNAPQLKRIGDYDFAYCKYLQKINAEKVSYLGTHCFDGCTMLKTFDASNVDTLASDALSFCYIDTFDAPKVKNFSLLEKYITYSHIRVLKLPNITGVLDPKCFDNSYVEEMYFDNIMRMSSGFKASNNLKVLYMPKCANYIDTKTDPTLHGDKQSPLQVLWIPTCKELSYDASDLKMLFAPSLTKLNMSNVNNLNMVLSESLKAISINFLNIGSSKIFAPDGSAAALYAKNNHIQLIKNENAINVVSYDSSSAMFKIKSKNFDFDLFDYASNIKYNCLYDYKYNELSVASQTFSLDFYVDGDDRNIVLNYSDLPAIQDKSDITLRACVEVDGVKFYSPVITGKLNEPPSCSEHISVFAVDIQDSCFVYNCKNCSAVFTVEADDVMVLWDNKYINAFVDDKMPESVQYLDVVHDGIINAKDYALILKTAQTQ